MSLHEWKIIPGPLVKHATHYTSELVCKDITTGETVTLAQPLGESVEALIGACTTVAKLLSMVADTMADVDGNPVAKGMLN